MWKKHMPTWKASEMHNTVRSGACSSYTLVTLIQKLWKSLKDSWKIHLACQKTTFIDYTYNVILQTREVPGGMGVDVT